ncbi:MAG: ABC transporter ATP-binding protein [Eubacteriales bacterium]|nr:ABC transporter ATP-binding protein [Clostridiales bacterium]
MIEVKNLTKKYGNILAVDNISFTIEKGKIYGLLGPNGAGKTTTMNIITGCLAATSGEVLINGHSIIDEPVEAKKYIGYLPEQPPLYADMTPAEYLYFVAEAKSVRADDIPRAVEEVMEETGITDVADRLIKNLSKGYRQRVGIAQAMLGTPEVIILDEPTVGLDPQQIIEIRELIKSLGRDRTVILSSHILPEVSAICDDIIIISHGKIVANGPMREISSSLKSETIMDISVKATEDEVTSVLSSISDITRFEITDTSTDVAGVSVTSAKVHYPTDIDLREIVTFAFSDIRRAIISMTAEESSLEEIFLQLTSDKAAALDEIADSDNEDGEISSHEKLFDGSSDVKDSSESSFATNSADDADDESIYSYNPEDYLATQEKLADYVDADEDSFGSDNNNSDSVNAGDDINDDNAHGKEI